MSVSDQDPQDHRVHMVHQASLDIIKDQVLKVIQAFQDLLAYLEAQVLLVKMDFQALQDKRETHIPTALLG